MTEIDWIVVAVFAIACVVWLVHVDIKYARLREFTLLADDTIDAARGIWSMPKNPDAHTKFRKKLRAYDRAKKGGSAS